MKTEVFLFELSLSKEDLIDAIKFYVENRGFIFVDVVTQNINEVKITAKKMEETKEINLEKVKIFPEIFIKRLSSVPIGLNMFIENISTDQVQKFIGKAFSLIEEKDQKILTFAYDLKKTNEISLTAKSSREICKEFNLVEKKFPLQDSFSKLSTLLNSLFLDALKSNLLNLRRNLSKEEVLSIEISKTGFSPRTCGCLSYSGINTVKELVLCEQNELRKIENMGELCFKEISSFRKLYKI